MKDAESSLNTSRKISLHDCDKNKDCTNNSKCISGKCVKSHNQAAETCQTALDCTGDGHDCVRGKCARSGGKDYGEDEGKVEKLKHNRKFLEMIKMQAIPFLVEWSAKPIWTVGKMKSAKGKSVRIDTWKI